MNGINYRPNFRQLRERNDFVTQEMNRFAGSGNYDDFIKSVRGRFGQGFTPDNSRYRFEQARKNFMQNQLQGEAKRFEQDLPNFTDKQYGLLRQDVEQGLNQGIDQTRKNYSARGLLYSGFRQGDESKLRSGAASQLAAGRVNINREARNLADSKKQTAAAYGLDSYNAALENSQRLFDLQLQNAAARRRSAQSLGSGLGYLAGYALGNRGTEGNDAAMAAVPYQMMPDDGFGG